MHSSVEKIKLVQNKINEIINKKQLKTSPKIIAVTKTWSIDKINPLLEFGHKHFGENKLQEAESKWLDIKNSHEDIQLHMIGKLQSNKAKKAVKLFDYIHSLDNAKLAQKIFQYQKELNKKVNLFIQVNIGDESQKSGVALNNLDNFFKYCTKELSLNIIGLMCLPPILSNSENHFFKLKSFANHLTLKELSMGMSSDFENAVVNGSTYLRLGSVIFGERKKTI
tara:strand:- start:411 stop:1082 length:672 start_codon:yes stop_codon:yes gene_type:complete